MTCVGSSVRAYFPCLLDDSLVRLLQIDAHGLHKRVKNARLRGVTSEFREKLQVLSEVWRKECSSYGGNTLSASSCSFNFGTFIEKGS